MNVKKSEALDYQDYQDEPRIKIYHLYGFHYFDIVDIREMFLFIQCCTSALRSYRSKHL